MLFWFGIIRTNILIQSIWASTILKFLFRTNQAWTTMIKKNRLTISKTRNVSKKSSSIRSSIRKRWLIQITIYLPFMSHIINKEEPIPISNWIGELLLEFLKKFQILRRLHPQKTENNKIFIRSSILCIQYAAYSKIKIIIRMQTNILHAILHRKYYILNQSDKIHRKSWNRLGLFFL